MALPSPRSLVATTLHVAGIGASAGGIEAMLPMFAQMRPTGRMAYVVAQHMAKDGHDELVVRLIGRESVLPVVLARQVESRKPDTVYVIPSGKDGTVSGTTLTLQDPAPGHLSTPSVNVLFTSLAESSRGNAIGIVLSGTGCDGVAGCRALKAWGGLTIAQDPAEAKFTGMPNASIDAHLVDQVLTVGAIGPTLAEKFPGTIAAPRTQTGTNTASLKDILATPPPPGPENRELAVLLPLVHKATGIDFSSYKEETLLRRLEKRKSTLGLTGDAYLGLVKRQPEELKILQHLFLVSVSSFFRDRPSFRELERALAGVLATKTDGDPVHVWVPGCASGEEPYTLAILLSELLGERRNRHPVRITGTDLNPEALDMARAGIYRQTAFREMEDALRKRYFTSKGHQHFEIGPVLREMVELEQCDVLSRTPVSQGAHLDLVSCRNLLIYMKSHLQDRLVTSFHRALAPQGLLFIGQSESLGLVGNSLFEAIDNYHRLFRRRH
ncbi:MAG: chemotaxis protein [Alphaproteobacteria bacterium]|nr:chemotaxis protein [Alphaproteobacteria bacterium]